MQTVMRLPAVMAATGKSRAWIYDAVKRGIFPRPLKIGSSTAFVSQEVEKYIVDLIAQRDASAPPPNQPAAPRRAKA